MSFDEQQLEQPCTLSSTTMEPTLGSSHSLTAEHHHHVTVESSHSLSALNNSGSYPDLTTAGDVELGLKESTIDLGLDVDDLRASTDQSSDQSHNAANIDLKKKKLSFSPTIPENTPVVLSWQNLSVHTTNKTPKALIDNINGSITGGFWAIMGASGGGKTTLLSALSLRLDPSRMKITGEVRLNGRQYSRKELKAMSAYVMQDDLLHPELTCKETLHYAAQLRLPQEFSDAQREARINACIDIMGIRHCSDIIVGDTRRKGISGGERKRLCIAIELLAKPRLIFLDEPTSGLDSSTALAVVDALKKLSDSGECTVVCTIHQPQNKIFNLFDNLILLKKGKIVYQGSCQKSLLFLESIGLACPKDTNPADFLLDVISPAAASTDKVDHAAEETRKLELPIDLSMGDDKDFFSAQHRANWIHQFKTLSRRSALQYYRRSDIMLLNFVSTTLIACFIGGGIWYQQDLSQKVASTTLVPSLFFACVTQGVFGSLQVVNTFPSERAIMLRERSAGTYYVSSYYMAKSLFDMLTQAWPPILFSCIAYFMLGYRREADRFFVYMAFMVLDSLAATSLATAVSCWCVSVEKSTVVLSFCFEACRLYGGFFTSPLQLKDYPNWRFVDALSYIKYVFVGVALNELEGLEFICPPTGTCTYPTGESVIKAKGYDQYTIGQMAGILIAYIVIARLLGYIALRMFKM